MGLRPCAPASTSHSPPGVGEHPEYPSFSAAPQTDVAFALYLAETTLYLTLTALRKPPPSFRTQALFCDMKFWIPLCALVLVQARCQPVRKYAYLTRSPVEVHGHRGCRGLMPENTWAAMEKALELGVQTLEMDVVLTRDSVFILSHEPWMNASICAVDPRVTKPNIFGMTAREVGAYDCGSLGHGDFPEQVKVSTPKPTLESVVEGIENWCATHHRQLPRLSVEIKSRKSWDNKYHPAPTSYAALFLDTYSRLGYQGILMVQCSDTRVLRELHAHQADLPLTYLSSDILDSPQKAVEQLGFSPNYYSVAYQLVTPSLLQGCLKQRMQLCAWTVNKPEDMNRMIDLGVSGIITDYPDRLIRVCKERGISTR